MLPRLLDAPASCLDGRTRAGGDCDATQLHGAGQLTLLDDLGTRGAGFDQASALQRFEVDDFEVELFQLVEQHFGDIHRHLRTETDLGQAALQRHLAAFETGLDLALAGPGELALVSAAAGLAETGTNAAANAHAFLAGTRGGFESIQTHEIDS